MRKSNILYSLTISGNTKFNMKNMNMNTAINRALNNLCESPITKF
jgi:hypothetical protein